MKSFFEEYGKIVFTTIIILCLVAYLLGSGSNGFLGILEKSKPRATVGTEDSVEILEDYSKRLEPVLEVKTKKLKANEPTDLFSFVTKTKGRVKVTDADGNVVLDENGKEKIQEVDLENYEIRIIQIVDQDKNDITLNSDPTNGVYSFSRLPKPSNPDEIYLDSYQVTYELTDKTISDYPIKTTRTYQFVVD